MRFSLVGVACLMGLVCSEAKTLWHQLENYTFEQWMKEYNQVYSSLEEYSMRKQIFNSRLEEIRIHNSKNLDSGWKKGVNNLSDRTEDEFRKLLGLKKHHLYTSSSTLKHHKRSHRMSSVSSSSSSSSSSLPASWDWRQKGVVSAVKDQGQCGSCWAFGSTATVESHYAIHSGHLNVLSEQQILDCTPNPDDCGGTGGCGGGTAELAYSKLISLGGQASEWTYPYRSYFGNNFPTCSFNASTTIPVAPVKGYVVLPSNEYEPVIDALVNQGPLAINVDASAWSTYESGVFTGCASDNIDVDHVVQLVGYGTDPKQGDYWIVRNSWSPSWGENGYIRLPRSSKPECGEDNKPSDGTGCTGGPATVEVCGACAILYDVSYPTF